VAGSEGVGVAGGGHRGRWWRAPKVPSGGRAGVPRLEGAKVERVARSVGHRGHRLREGWRGRRGQRGNRSKGASGPVV
jgi:hypothetical protein